MNHNEMCRILYENASRTGRAQIFPMATEAIACPFLRLAMMPLDQCQPSVYSLPLLGLGAFFLLCPMACVPPIFKKTKFEACVREFSS